MTWWSILLIVLGGVLALGGIVLWIYLRVRRRTRDDNYVKRHRHGKWTF